MNTDRTARAVLSALFICVCTSITFAVQFKPLDPNNTNPTDYFFPVWNPVPEDYCAEPRFPIVPPIGPIIMPTMHELFPNGTAAPTNSWQRQLWGFKWDDDINWNGVYAYPYIVSPKSGGISIMYPGPPDYQKGANENSRSLFQMNEPPAAANLSVAAFPDIILSEAFDFGLLIKNGDLPNLTDITPFSATITYLDSANGNASVANYYIVKGSPYVSIECTSASIGFGSLVLGGVPPIISINGKPPGSTVTSDTFVMQVAQGPTHADATWWHVYFDSQVTITFPASPSLPFLPQPYTGLVQMACGAADDVMATWLDKYARVYATGADLDFGVDESGNSAKVTYIWRKSVSPNAAQSDLGMLALPHHSELIQSNTNQSAPQNTSFWTIKGNMWGVVGDTWTLSYNLTQVGFGDNLTMDDAMSADVEAQLLVDYKFLIEESGCPGDNDTPGQRGWNNVELYAYVRDLATYTDLAIVAQNVGNLDMAANITKRVLFCMAPVLEKQTQSPQPCEAPVNNTLTCLRNQMALWYDTKWGGLVTGFYNRFAFDYCQGCANEAGYYPFNNYGNSFYNDHHFQYGYIVRSLAHALYLINNGVDLGISQQAVEDLKTQALLFAREYANPDPESDSYFTLARHKDFFDGHSWAEGYDFSGRSIMWVNQQSGGEAVNAYYGVYLLGLALNDTNTRDWGRILLAMEAQAVRRYQHLSNRTQTLSQEPFPLVNDVMKCMPMINGNGLTGATYFGPNALFSCGITLLPITPIFFEWVDPVWAGEAYTWLSDRASASTGGGVCIYPDPAVQSTNPCPGSFGGAWWGNEYECCPLDDGAGHLFPYQQWKSFPNWYPFMYLLQAANDTQTAWSNLNPSNPLNQPSGSLPFPYFNSKGQVVGYPDGLIRTTTLFVVSTHSNSTISTSIKTNTKTTRIPISN